MLVLAACSTGDSRGPVAVAVFDLEDLSSPDRRLTDVGGILAGQIMARLDASREYQVVDRQDLLKVLEELRLGSSDLADAQTRLRLGRIIGAKQMIFGAFQAVGPMARVDLRLVDVASGKIMQTGSGIAPAADLNGWLQASDQAAAELFK
ncbi:MAG: hypothetical protein C4519_21645 [Desulfobacteraceae bacterium]|nr:MAG: hypothetical protein C4519_21645 [Desulfobacteraceae bacterium]